MNDDRLGKGPLNRHAWVLDSLPTETQAVIGSGDPTLGAYLEACGLRADDPMGANALVAEVPAGARNPDLASRVEPAARTEVVAVAVGGGPPGRPVSVSRPRRALQLLSAPARAAHAAIAARRVARLLRERGFDVQWSAVGERSRRHGLGREGWGPGSRPPLGWIVAGSRGDPRPSIVASALAAAERQSGLRLCRRRATVFESGKLLVRVATPGGEEFLLRLAAGPAAPHLAASADCVLAIARGCDDPRLIDRLATPRVRGRSGPAEFSLEPTLSGRPLRRTGKRFEEEVLEFLVTLRESSPPAALADPSLELQLERLLGILAEAEERAAARRVVAEMERRVADLRGGIGHGDFWRENLLERGGGLVGVVDWEWCSRESLPLLDMFDFLTLSRRASQPTSGVRFTEQLWPQAREGGQDPLVTRYCHLTGVPSDTSTLEALAVAYWLDRASRELQPWWGRRQRPDWVATNIRRPLAVLREAGW